jgi:branched-chain amino acid transport system substrate-binding protein
MFDVKRKRAITKLQTIIIIVVLVIAIVCGTLAYFYIYQKPVGEKAPIKIGVLCPLSPPGAYGVGHYIKRGALVAAKYINEHGGILNRTLEIVVEDDAGTPEVGVAAAEKLITKDGVVAITGQYHSSVCLAVQDVCEQYHVPLLVTQASSVKITEKGLNYTFRPHVMDPDRVKFWYKWITQANFKRVAMIAEDTDYGIGLKTYTELWRNDLAPNVELKIMTVPLTSIDVTPQLLEIKAWNPDLLIVSCTGALARLVVTQAYDIGLTPTVPILGAHDFPLEAGFWDSVGKKGEGIYFIGYYHPQMNLTSFGKEIRKMYFEEYGEEPIYASLNTAGNIWIIKQAIEKAGSAKPEDIYEALRTETFVTWNTENVKFPEEKGIYWHHFRMPMIVFQLQTVGQTLKDAKIIFTG